MSPRFHAVAKAAAVAAACAALAILLTFTLGQRSHDCVSDGSVARNSVMRGPDGKLLFFDGHCWVSSPQPPNQMPW